MLKNLGQRIRQLRKEKGITLVEIAKKTGVAQATLSRIETGVMMGTVESHEKIAEAIGIGLAELYTGVDKRYEQITHQRETSRKITHHSKQVTLEFLTQEGSKKKITPLLLTLQPSAQTQRETQERGVEKFVFVLEGRVTAKIAQEEFDLTEGETLYFDASLAHQFINQPQGKARILIAVSPAKF